MSRIGCMQGRLVPPEPNRFQSFPRSSWEKEFGLAQQAQLECIEWIYDAYGEDVNPIQNDEGVKKILELSDKYGIKILSLCADYFMDYPLLRLSEKQLDERMAKLIWLMQRCQLLGINRIVLPFVDSSKIENESELHKVISILMNALSATTKTGIEIHLETSLDPMQYEKLLGGVADSRIKVNYDSGNSSSLGYYPYEEFAAYGDNIGSVHIKDRVRGGGTVPLGKGDVDFPSLFKCLKNIEYGGDYILQVARGESGKEVSWARQNRAFVYNCLME